MKKHKLIIGIVTIFMLVTILLILFVKNENNITVGRKTNFLESGTSGTCKYVLNSDGDLVISPRSGTSGTMGIYNASEGFYQYEANIKTIRFEGNISAPQNSTRLFYFLRNVESIDFTNFSTQGVTKMEQMFCDCRSLISLDISNFDTSQVTTMKEMFNYCEKLISLNLSGFNTTNVTTMRYMFGHCYVLPYVDLTSLNTTNVTDMYGMFNRCLKIQNLNFSTFNTVNVIKMGIMFSYCRELKNLDLSSFNTVNVAKMERMFDGCGTLASLDISNFNTATIDDMEEMFKDCSALKSLSLGTYFSFETNCALPEDNSSPWRKIGTARPVYSSAELINTYDGLNMAGTYVRYTSIPITININRNDLLWQSNGMRVALYQNGVEMYSYNAATVSQTEGTITWSDVEGGTYDVYASKDSTHKTTMVDTGEDVIV